MEKSLLSILLLIFLRLPASSQIIDTVYFDLEGEIMIKEFASFYRVAEFDTVTGNILGDFKDYSNIIGSQIASGEVINDQIENYLGDSLFFQTANKMLDLQASYIRINDYPELRKSIKLAVPIQERLTLKTAYADMKVIQANPEFIGGMETLYWFIGNLIQYPEEARMNLITGTVKVKFMIDVDGSIKNISVIKGIGYSCDEEAIRVISLLPDWLPGLNNGVPVPVYFSIPLSFQ